MSVKDRGLPPQTTVDLLLNLGKFCKEVAMHFCRGACFSVTYDQFSESRRF